MDLEMGWDVGNEAPASPLFQRAFGELNIPYGAGGWKTTPVPWPSCRPGWPAVSSVGIPHGTGSKPKPAPSDGAELPVAALGGSTPVKTQPLGSGTAAAWGSGVSPRLPSSVGPSTGVFFSAFLVPLVFLDCGRPRVELNFFSFPYYL